MFLKIVKGYRKSQETIYKILYEVKNPVLVGSHYLVRANHGNGAPIYANETILYQSEDAPEFVLDQSRFPGCIWVKQEEAELISVTNKVASLNLKK
jgi:hypothetical protein